MQIGGQEFSGDILGRISQVVADNPTISRGKLSRQVCEWLDWRTSAGKLQEGSCRKALAELRKKGILRLPAATGAFSFGQTRQVSSLAGMAVTVADICCSLDELGGIDLVPVTSRYCKDSRIWRALLDEHHYLGSGTLAGAQIRYVIKSARYGYLGALAFSSATWALRERDEYIGWCDAARSANLKQVLTNNRFLIVPTVRVPNLASFVLAAVLRRLPGDWEARYKVRPVLVETFIDPTRFKGSCYKASGWINVGRSAGRRDGIKKSVYLHPLTKKWRGLLRTAPVIPLGASRRPEHPKTWAEQEFGSARFHDHRLKERLYTIARDFFSRSDKNIPEACGTKARTMAAYRFFSNPKVNMDVILTPHTEATIERIKEHKVVLAPQDTTSLNYCTHPATDGLGPINTKANSSVGLILHDTLAFTENGTPLGVLDAQCWARKPEEQGKSEKRKELPIEQKESIKWLRSYRRVAEVQKCCPDTMLVSIGDRESDIYELFLEAAKDSAGPKLLVRAEKSRNRTVEQKHLWKFMYEVKPEKEPRIVNVPRRDNRPGRKAVCDIRFAQVELASPKSKDYPPITMWAVYLLERPNKSVASPLEWMLLTTAPVNTLRDAEERIDWYGKRWGIEVYHRTLKSGCQIESRQLGSADRLTACIGVDMVVAWRVFHLTMLAREKPNELCTLFFEEVEWKALCCYYGRTNEPPRTPPTMIQAARMVGLIGGHMGRVRDGMPGTECIWRGLQRLDTAVDMYAIFKQEPIPHIRKFYTYAMLPQNSGP